MGSNPTQSIKRINNEDIGEYLSLLELKGDTNKHKNEVQRYLINYKKYILSAIEKKKSIEYLKNYSKNIHFLI